VVFLNCFFVLFCSFCCCCSIIVGFLTPTTKYYIVFYFYFYFLSVLLTSPSLSSHSYSYPLYSLLFPCATIHCSPSQLLFLLHILHSLPLSSPPPLILGPNVLPHYSSLLTLTTCWLAYSTNFLQNWSYLRAQSKPQQI
jgi:hypothetical protein